MSSRELHDRDDAAIGMIDVVELDDGADKRDNSNAVLYKCTT